MFIAIDPGKNVGVATFKSDGSDIMHTTMKEDKFLTFLANTNALINHGENRISHVTFIMEDYRLRNDKAIEQTGSDMPAPRMIGAVQFFQTLNGDRCKLVLQQPNILYTALKWAGYPDMANRSSRKFHVPDQIAARAHGVYYLIDRGIREHPIFKDKS